MLASHSAINAATVVPSPYQQAFFDNVATGEGHTMLSAVPGSGKTTTLVWSLERLPSSAKILVVSFSRRTTRELKSRTSHMANVTVVSLNSLGNRACVSRFGRRVKLNNDKVPGIISYLLEKLPTYLEQLRAEAMNEDEQDERDLLIESFEDELRAYKHAAIKVVGLCKATLAMKPEEIAAMLSDRDIDVPGEGADDTAEFVRVVRKALEVDYKGREDSIDYDDQIWLPIIMDMDCEKFTHVFVDEAQDLNLTQIRLILKSLEPGGRIFVIGDPRQAIFAFRGADHRAMARLQEELSATMLPLSVCYRCARTIVEVAKSIVPEIEPSPAAEEGIVRSAKVEEMLEQVAPGDFILSRSNAPLMGLCMELLREGRPAIIEGVDIADKFKEMVRRSRAKTVAHFVAWINDWAKKESDRLAARGSDTKTVDDTAACLLILAEGAETISDIRSRLETMFADDSPDSKIVLSTTHKAKGLERNRAFLLRWTFMKTREGQTQTAAQAREEENLFYVAVTRARRELVFVEERQ